MPTVQRSLVGHPGATFFKAQLAAHLFVNFFTSSCPRNSPETLETAKITAIGMLSAYLPHKTSEAMETKCLTQIRVCLSVS
jgi:hypothetical protein